MFLHSAAVACLILAAAGLQLPLFMQRIQLVVLADVSDSILDKQIQTARMQELLQVLDPRTTDVAVAVFATNVGTERRLSPLPETQAESSPSARHKSKPESLPSAQRPPLPDLQRLKTDIHTSATDIGRAIDFARGIFAPGGARAILLISDFRDTRSRAVGAAAALSGSGISLLATPTMLSQSEDVYISSLRVPEIQRAGRAVPIDVTVAGLSPRQVKVAVMRQRLGQEPLLIDTKIVALESTSSAELRKTIRCVDAHSDSSGMIIYTVRLSAVEGELINDIRTNNELSAAVKIVGASNWAVLTRSGATLDTLCATVKKPLGVNLQPFYAGALPTRASAYQHFDGILVDGLSADELKDAPLKALAEAIDSGKGLVALGGEQAFGAGRHPRDGAWEQLLPAQMTPEDDRRRAVLFVIDISKSMEQRMSGSGRKIDFAREQLARAVQRLKPLDRLGLITFSNVARVSAPLSAESTRAPFLEAVQKARIEEKTNILAALKTAKETLKADDSEEQLVIILSDGVDTAGTPREEIVEAAKALCPPPAKPDAPRRVALFTFGIDVNSKEASAGGEKLLKDIAVVGGGQYSPEFTKLAERLELAFEGSKKDFFVRHEPFALQARRDHPLLQGGRDWPELNFRNRVKAKPRAETLLFSATNAPDEKGFEHRRPDPIFVVSGVDWPGAARSAVLALSLDGAAGTAFLGAASAQSLLSGLLDWVEARPANRPGILIRTDSTDGEQLEVEARASDPELRLPLNGLKFNALLTPIVRQSGNITAGAVAPQPLSLKPVAPGVYRAVLPVESQSIYRLLLRDEKGLVDERFVSTPYSAELRRFGVERAAMFELVHKAGGDSRVIESPQDLERWAATQQASQSNYALRPWLFVLGLLLLLIEFATRGMKS
ncbi:MAG: VWA domain-containing protein [Planctomycetota bacterium]